MSTKSTLSYGDGFHLYSEGFDDEHIYFELNGCEFDSSNHGVTVRIPLEIWEVVRERTNASFSMADMTDEQIEEKAKAFVAERKQHCDDAEAQGRNSFWSCCGMIGYGTADDPIDEQIARGIGWEKAHRETQRTLRKRIAEIKSKQQR